MKEVVIVSACRTAIGAFGGTLRDSNAAVIGSVTMKEAIKQRMRWASKGLHYTIPMSLSLVAVFLYNLLLFITIPLFFFNLSPSAVPLVSLIIKTIVDFILIYLAGNLVNESKLVKYFSLVFVFVSFHH